MRVLLDTNVLLRMATPGHSMHSDAVSAVERLRAAGNQLVIVPQVLYEYWVVATRPASLNGLGLLPEEVRQAIDEFLLTFFSCAMNAGFLISGLQSLPTVQSRARLHMMRDS